MKRFYRILVIRLRGRYNLLRAVSNRILWDNINIVIRKVTVVAPYLTPEEFNIAAKAAQKTYLDEKN